MSYNLFEIFKYRKVAIVILLFLFLFFILLQRQIVDASLTSISYTYDKLNRIISINYNNSTLFFYEYDAAGNITKTKVVYNNKIIGLDDAIVALQILSNFATDYKIFNQDDINGNNRIDLGEVVYILKLISSVRWNEPAFFL